MYDSENIPLATRIEAGAGVTISHATNSDGDAVWTAQVDETWLLSWVNANSAGALKLNDSDEARLRAVEDALGIVPEPVTPPETPPTGTAGTTEVTVSADVAITTGDIIMNYGFVGIDGTTVIDANMTGTDGATPRTVLMAIYSQIKRNNGMLKYATPSYDFDSDKLILTWTEAGAGFSFTYSITSQGAGDNLSFTATDY